MSDENLNVKHTKKEKIPNPRKLERRKKLSLFFKDYRSYIVLGIFVLICVFSGFYFTHSYVRLWQALKDFGFSICYYFEKLFGLDIKIDSSVQSIPSDFYRFQWNIDVNWDIFAVKFKSWWFTLFSMNLFSNYWNGFANVVFFGVQILMILVLLGLIIYLLFKRYWKPNKRKPNSDSKPLKIHKVLVAKIYTPVKNWFQFFFDYFRQYRWVKWLLLLPFLFDFNIFVIVLEFFAYYFYFIVSFDLVHLYTQVYKLIGDLSPALTFFPFYIGLLIFFIYRFHKRRFAKGYASLNQFEGIDKRFVSSLGVANMICGSMGVGKTSTMTDMALSLNQYYRYKAMEKVLEQDIKFPHFPWILLENALKDAIDQHIVYNLSSCKEWVHNLQMNSFAFNPEKQSYSYIKENCFNYDGYTYGFSYCDGLKEQDLFEVLMIYVQCYFIYVVQTSLIVSNYSIRDDDVLIDQGNFPFWNNDFFSKDPRLSDVYSHYSHISDFDMFRLGQKVQSNDRFQNAFEFGVLCITESGKERLNMMGTKNMRDDVPKANQTNDQFNLFVKMFRHSATIDNFCFGTILMDEQRSMSVNADLRESCQDIVFIDHQSEKRCVLSFSKFSQRFFSWFDRFWNNLYTKYRSVRSDNTLFMTLGKDLSSYFLNRFNRLQNTFGYYKLDLLVSDGMSVSAENGNIPSNNKKITYYLCLKKIYSNRYDTACFSDFFFAKSSLSDVGLADIPCYSTYSASIDELMFQHSYFIDSLVQLLPVVLNTDSDTLDITDVNLSKEDNSNGTKKQS